ncbi:receptor-like protein kinase FERONIA [Bidens hawaiensis]|uniref:receptor-like protein kinase FERONIA n=1 Tax=Bidens hawaiensis TaxID=980011 RepID=UPI00404AA8A9
MTSYGVEEELDEIIDPSLKKQMDTQSLSRFKELAYKCLNQQLMQRPTMDQIVIELKEVLELQWKHENLEHSVAADEDTSSNILKMDFLKIPLSEIKLATNNFDEGYSIGSGEYGIVYKANLDVYNTQSLSSSEGKCKPKINKTVAIKRIFSRADEQGKQGFLTEIELLTSCKHPNIVSLLGFSREAREMILVYEYAFKGSLSDYLGYTCKTTNLTWAQRIQICLDVAHGINYLHTNMEGKPRIIHRDIKSENILLDEYMNAKIADFGLSKFHPMKQQASTICTKTIAGTEVYMDPEYLTTFKYKRESDIYSFGVVLFEVLSGRVAYDLIYLGENNMGLAPIARRRFNEGTLKELLDPKIIEEDGDHLFTINRGPNQDSFDTFSKIAYRCLAETQAKRPTMEAVIEELQNALNLQGETMVLLRFRLGDLALATENFAETYCIGLDSHCMVYGAELDDLGNYSSLATEGKNNGEPSNKHITAAIKRITNRKGGKAKQGFFAELEMRAYKHRNIVSILGFCDQGDEMILVYENASDRSLDDYLKNVDNMDNFTWTHRLRMCLEIARGLDHLHTKMANLQTIIHNDIRSATILLDKKGEAKIASFGISKLHPTNQEVKIKVYEDPEYEKQVK